jgi:uncharacterized protein YbcI
MSPPETRPTGTPAAALGARDAAAPATPVLSAPASAQPRKTRLSNPRDSVHLTGAGGTTEVAMKSQGEIEAAVSDGIARLQVEYMGRGPKDVRSHLIGDLLLVRLRGVLTAAEQHLVKALPVEKGRDLLKQVRTQLVEIARPLMEAVVEHATGSKVKSLHHDISTVTGEEIVLFTLETSPPVRDVRK